MWVTTHLLNAKPRVIQGRQALPPVLVFSDGACEDDGTSVGAVLFDPLSSKLHCFGAEISQRTLNTWKSRLEQTQVIGQAELFPLLVARLTWHKILAGRRCIFFSRQRERQDCHDKGIQSSTVFPEYCDELP